MSFFDIKSVAIVGASEQIGKLGNSMLGFLKSFPGNKYGVNPKGGNFLGIKFYESISTLPEIVDILVFVIPTNFILNSFIEAGKMGVKRVIIISAGFKEVGNFELEEDIKEIARKYDIMLLGPNCLGYVDTYKDLNLSFGTKKVNKGNISVISQSGAMAVAITDWASTNNLGFSKIISLGNKAGVDEVDFLLELENDDTTSVIVLYLESLERGKLFYEATKRISKTKPIIILKSGISSKGKEAASSHTGAISSDEDILFTVFDDAGLHHTNNLGEFLLWIEIFSKVDFNDIPKDLVILTNAGGPGVITTDYTEKYGVELQTFTEKEKGVLKEGLKEGLIISNPIDIIGDATSKTYLGILNNLKKLKNKKTILILLTAQSVTDVENISNVIVDFKKENNGEFLLTSFIGGKGVLKGIEILSKNSVLNYSDPGEAINCFSRLLIQKKLANKIEEKINFEKKNTESIKQKIKNEKLLFSNSLINEILSLYDINFIEDILVKEKSEIENVFKKINSKSLVAKISSNDIAHKSDIGGIVLNIKSIEEAKDAYETIINNVKKSIPNAKINGITFGKMLEVGEGKREIFLGFKRDISFGNIMILGMGGIYVNVFEDIKMSIGITSKSKILNMLEGLKYYPILKGYRGQVGINFDSLVDIIYKIQFIFRDFEEIKEIDINPIICDENESIIVDTKLYL